MIPQIFHPCRAWLLPIGGLVVAVPWSGGRLGAALAAQVVPDAVTCRECRITSDVIASMGEEDGPGMLSNVFRVVVDQRGRYWVFSEGLMPKVFDGSGRFDREVGAPGRGPGEFQVPTDMWELPGDSLAIVDGGVLIHVLGPELRYVRTVRSPLFDMRDRIVMDWPHEVLVNAFDPTPERFGIPLHIVDFSGSTGEVRRSFGGTDGPVTQSSVYSLVPRDLVRAAGGGYWATESGRYRVSRWSSSHRLEFALERRPEWFAERSDMLDGGPVTPPSPHCLGVSEDRAGLVWTFCLVASPRYRDAWRAIPEAVWNREEPVEVPSDAVEHQLLYHTRVEILNPVTRRVVAGDLLDYRITSVLPERRVARVVHSPTGVPTVEIIRFNLEGYRP